MKKYSPISCSLHDYVRDTWGAIYKALMAKSDSTGFSVVAAWTILTAQVPQTYPAPPSCETCSKLFTAHGQFLKAFYEAKHGWKEE